MVAQHTVNAESTGADFPGATNDIHTWHEKHERIITVLAAIVSYNTVQVW